MSDIAVGDTMTPDAELRERSERLDGPVHTHFGLSYANYLVVPRTLLQSMPVAWQERFVACLDELDEAFIGIEQAEAYEVTPGEDRYLSELTEKEGARLGWRIEWREDDTLYIDPDGVEIDSADAQVYHVLWPTPDPVPHYNRGRTYIPPQT